jgi:nitrate/nitrite transporter NarK
MLGFAGSAATAVALAVWPGDPALCLALAATLGLVQGAGFAAVPELNSGTEERAQANGALAQTGNIGNTFGPPVLLAILGAGGHTAMLLVAAGVLAAGLLAQQALARARTAVR